MTRGARHGARAGRLAPRRRVQPRRGRRLRAHRPGGDRHHRRHRRQPRDGPPLLAGAARHAARHDGHRRPRVRRRPDARHHRRRRRPPGQPRPDVALHRGHAELGPDLARPRHPHPARPLVDVVRRPRPPPARALPARATTRSARCGTCAPPRTSPATTTPGSSSPSRSSRRSSRCPGSEQNPDITSQGPPGLPAHPAARQGRLRTGRGVQAARRRLRRRRHPGRARRQDERAHRQPAPGRRGHPRARSRPATCRWPTRYSKDAQIQGIRNARRYIGDRLGRTAAPHRILDPAAGPLIGVKLHVLTRKTLGGIQTDLDSRALGTDGRAHRRPVRGRRGRRLRRRRRPRLQRAGRHLPRRLPLLRARRRPGRGDRAVTLRGRGVAGSGL